MLSPTSQFVQPVAPANEYKPVRHPEQAATEGVVAYVPAAQVPQVVSTEAEHTVEV